MSDPYIGQVNLAAFPFPPYGWALCDGTLVQIRQNTALFSVIGTYFGGDGQNTFALPDLRGRVPMGASQAHRVGAADGRETIALTAAQAPPHTHGLSCQADPTQTPATSGLAPASGLPLAGAEYVAPASQPLVSLNAASIQPAGGGQSHNNIQPSVVVNFAIATMGIFPVRP